MSGMRGTSGPAARCLALHPVSGKQGAVACHEEGLSMAQVTLQNLVKKFSEEVIAVNNVNLEIQDKEFVVLVGP
jgi:ABC-type bacteriocin/lantibiotic exporter with double-glycine peptidase domain